MAEKVFPTVSCDVRLGEQFSEVYCNPRYLTARARELGMNSDQIADLSVHFSAELPSDDIAVTHTLGLYEHDDRRLTVFLGHKAAAHHEVATILSGMRNIPAKDRKRIGRRITAKQQIAVNDTLLHELRHAADFALTPDEAVSEERKGHYEVTFGRRERFEKHFGTLGMAGMFGVMAGMYDMLNTAGEGADRPVAIVVGSSILGILGFSQSERNRRKNYFSSKQSHQDYLARPWEVRAREYGAQNAVAATNAQPPLMRYTVKQLTQSKV